jgi:hypothetical protein
VRRMLLTAKAYAEGARALTSYVALQIDRELNHPDEEVRKEAAGEVALLTPIVKAFITDNGWIATSEAMQVYGGHGYISEWGMEQYVRDARINMIYEGTNTIQSLDLLGRKILMDNGAKLRAFGEKIKAFGEDRAGEEGFRRQVLRSQAGHGPLLLRPPVPGNRDADPPGTFGCCEFAGAGCGSVLSTTIT